MLEMPTDAEPVRVVQGDCLEVLRALPDGCVDAVITDPPYSSGGFTRSDKAAPVAEKYQQSGTERQYAAFSGDNRDSRSWAFWSCLWVSECQRILKPGGYCLLFTDWRQLPTTTDIMQGGGLIWRGLVSWDKGRGARAPHKGYFRHQCEYVVWGTNGPCDVPPVDDPRGGPWDGSFTVPVLQDDKHHVTGKPTRLMRELVKVAPVGGLILDPVAGSGTTGHAAIAEDRRAILIEKEPAYAAIARRRVREAMGTGLLAGVV
jgi:site-specific DNA-methyltransferase (adenine-specific)